tara:strand:+ start:8519 stop:9709 length:1191 start_codon:yes stop_codon:yes gene_type:complete
LVSDEYGSIGFERNMNDMQIGQPLQLYWLWAILACALLGIYAAVRNRRALRRFAQPYDLAKRLVDMNLSRVGIASFLTLASMVMLVIALVDIRWGKVWREVPQKGIEVMFVLDVSRSMLAEDVSPNRLQRAKQQISDAIDEMQGDRVGLILFSGEVRQKIPLTNHYEDFRQRLRNVGPEDVARGGSRLGDAIRVATGAFLDKTPDHKAIVIFTDGEDMESEPVAAARTAKKQHGIRIFCIGLGDPDTGARVPDRTRGRFVKHEGVEVVSRLNASILRQVADASDGAYIPAETKQVDMAQVYHGYISRVEQGEFATARINSYEARFQWFLGPAILLLVLEQWLAGRTTSGAVKNSDSAADDKQNRDKPSRPVTRITEESHIAKEKIGSERELSEQTA